MAALAYAQKLPWAVQALLIIAAFTLALVAVVAFHYLRDRFTSRVLHIRPSRQPLPEGTFQNREEHITSVIASSEGAIYECYRRAKGAIDQPDGNATDCIVLGITNHSSETLADVTVVLTAVAMRVEENGSSSVEIERRDITLFFDTVRAGDDHTAYGYVTNETPHFISLNIKEAFAAPMGAEPRKVTVHSPRALTSAMWLRPPKRFERVASECR